jgi:perosamine synthetase
MKNKIPIYKPFLKKYKKSAIDSIESEWISNHGKYINLATNKLKEILDVKNIILMNNGTTATHCLFLSLKFKYPCIKKIYIPNNVYVAVYNCALMVYPQENLEVMKINEYTWNMEDDEDYLLSLEKDSAIVIVHNLGGIIDVDRIKKIRPDIILIEDNCEGLFGKYNNKFTGTSNNILCSSVSFYGNKTITTGEGGAFITSDDEIYNYVKKIYTQGMSEKRFIHDVHAYNYRMTNIQAAFLYDQLNDINTILNMKNKVFANYEKLLEGDIKQNKLSVQKINYNCNRANWMFTIRLNNNKMSIDELNNYFTDQNGIEIRPFFYPYKSHDHLINLNSHSNDDISDLLNSNIIMLPSYPELSESEQEYICKILKNIIQ